MHEIDKADERMKNCKGWTEVPKKDVPNNAKPLASTQAFKKKSNSKCRGRLNNHGFKEVGGVHYNKDNVAAHVANEVTIRVAIVTIMVLKLNARLLDIKGAFLQG